jgi:hypothetical protein
MKTKKPSAIVYGWPTKGSVTLRSDIYFEENLYDEVLLYSLDYKGNLLEDYSKYRPDLIISIIDDISVTDERLKEISFVYNYQVPGNVLANDIVVQSTFRNCSLSRPKFSIFTPTYDTHPLRLKRLYESLKAQTIGNWEWIVLDDTPGNSTWDIINEIAQNDYRVKPHKMLPTSGGNIGLVKRRAAMLCEGDWLLELDHDDALISNCLEVCLSASSVYKDAGFIYTDCCELYEDGEFKSYDHDRSGNWYGREDNRYCWGYAGHTIRQI